MNLRAVACGVVGSVHFHVRRSASPRVCIYADRLVRTREFVCLDVCPRVCSMQGANSFVSEKERSSVLGNKACFSHLFWKVQEELVVGEPGTWKVKLHIDLRAGFWFAQTSAHRARAEYERSHIVSVL